MRRVRAASPPLLLSNTHHCLVPTILLSVTAPHPRRSIYASETPVRPLLASRRKNICVLHVLCIKTQHFLFPSPRRVVFSLPSVHIHLSTVCIPPPHIPPLHTVPLSITVHTSPSHHGSHILSRKGQEQGPYPVDQSSQHASDAHADGAILPTLVLAPSPQPYLPPHQPSQTAASEETLHQRRQDRTSGSAAAPRVGSRTAYGAPNRPCHQHSRHHGGSTYPRRHCGR